MLVPEDGHRDGRVDRLACTGGPLEVLVGAKDLDAARELLPERVT